MKLSSRKQLLEEADEVLSEIRKRINEFDWKSHEEWASLDFGGTKIAPARKRFLEAKLKRDLKVIENKYKDKNDPVSKQKEIEELTQFMDRLIKHFETTRVFSRDPEKQTELEKMIINTPNPGKVNVKDPKQLNKLFIKDPETGLYYHVARGTPEWSPEMQSEYIKWVVDDTVGYEWDNNRGWFYNTIMMILTGHG